MISPPHPPPTHTRLLLPQPYAADQVSERVPSEEASEEDFEAVGRALGGDGAGAPPDPRKSMWQLALERERVGRPPTAAERGGGGGPEGF
jgi:hypothetical protein